MRNLRLLLVSLLLLAGCAPGFTPFREVEKSRVVGAIVAVDSDPTVATPAPGESATMTLVVADPGPKEGRTWALVVCRPGLSQLDAVYCNDPSLLVGASYSPNLPASTPPIPDPSVQFTVPDATTLGDAKELWVMGAVCNGGTVRDLVADPPVYGQPWEPCMPDPAADPQPVGQLITTRIKLHLDANSLNHRPDLLSLQLDGVDWTSQAPEDAPVDGCAGLGYPEMPADGMPHPVTATSNASSREVYVPDGQTTAYPEDLFLYLFRTAGDTDIAYGTIDDASSIAMLEYTPPAATQVAQTGTLVRFWVQLTDERKASTFAQRAICVVPP